MKKKDQVTAAEEQKEAVQVKGKKRRAREAQREIRWDRLDNTAHLFSGDSRGEHEQCIPHQRDAHGAGGP